jgi:hypothetical protein
MTGGLKGAVLDSFAKVILKDPTPSCVWLTDHDIAETDVSFLLQSRVNERCAASDADHQSNPDIRERPQQVSSDACRVVCAIFSRRQGRDHDVVSTDAAKAVGVVVVRQ